MSFDFLKSFLLLWLPCFWFSHCYRYRWHFNCHIVWEMRARLFMTLFEAKPVILHACACAPIKEVCVSPDSFSITSCTLPSSCEMNQLGFDLSHYTKNPGLETTAISSLHCSKQGFNSWMSNVNLCFLIPVHSLFWGHFLQQVRLSFSLLETVPRFIWESMVTCIFIQTQVTLISTGCLNQTTKPQVWPQQSLSRNPSRYFSEEDFYI